MRRLGRSVAQPGRALCSGRRGRRFESSHSDHSPSAPQAKCPCCVASFRPPWLRRLIAPAGRRDGDQRLRDRLQPGRLARDLPAVAALRGRVDRHRQVVDRRHAARRTALRRPGDHGAVVAHSGGDARLRARAVPARLGRLPGRRRDAEPGGDRLSAHAARCRCTRRGRHCRSATGSSARSMRTPTTGPNTTSASSAGAPSPSVLWCMAAWTSGPIGSSDSRRIADLHRAPVARRRHQWIERTNRYTSHRRRACGPNPRVRT